VCVCQAAGCACKYELMQELCVYVCVCVCDQIFNIGAPTKWTGPNRKIMSRTPVVKHAAVLVQSHHPPANGIAVTNKDKEREREGVLGGGCEQCKTARLVSFLSLCIFHFDGVCVCLSGFWTYLSPRNNEGWFLQCA
jgi:hypothetical protein